MVRSLPPLIGLSVALALAWGLGAGSAGASNGGMMGNVPDPVRDLTVRQKINQQVPLGVLLRDEQGRQVRLGDYFKTGRPVIINLGYYGCPRLCGQVLNGLSDSMRQLTWNPGQEYEVITVSINPAEDHTLAAARKVNQIADLGRPQAAAGWHWLTGEAEQTRALADAVGFEYRWDPEGKQFVHPAVIVIATPDGRVSRYLFGVEFPAKTLRLSLVEASEGKVGSIVDQFILFCFHYDPATGAYGLAARNLMRLGGAITVLVVAGLIARALWRELRRRRTAAPAAA